MVQSISRRRKKKKLFNSPIRVLAGGDPSQTGGQAERVGANVEEKGQTTRNQGLDRRVQRTLVTQVLISWHRLHEAH